MKRLLCTICLLLLLAGCATIEHKETMSNQDINYTSKDALALEIEEQIKDSTRKLYENFNEAQKQKKVEPKQTTKIIEIRTPAKKALERIDLMSGKGTPVFTKAIDGKYIRIGPGMEYANDDTGPLVENEKLYVLEEKFGWICFRVTEKNLGWSAWIKKDLTDSFAPLSGQNKIPDYLTNENLTQLEKLHRWVQDGLAEGVFHSVNVEYNEVRIEPANWYFLPIETKKQLILTFSKYFDLRGSTARVTIFSKYSDEKLGSYSVWTGIKVYK